MDRDSTYEYLPNSTILILFEEAYRVLFCIMIMELIINLSADLTIRRILILISVSTDGFYRGHELAVSMWT
jgi:hypothetical protein